jgi:hypothetical protein
MPRDKTKLHHLPAASAGRGPPWLIQLARRPAGLASPVQPVHNLVTLVA